MEVPYFQLLEENKNLRAKNLRLNAENLRLNEVICHLKKKYEDQRKEKVVFPPIRQPPSNSKPSVSTQVKTLLPPIREERESPPVDATKGRRDDMLKAGDPGPINGSLCPSRPAGIPTKPSTGRRRVFKRQVQRTDQKPAGGEGDSLSEKERQIMAKEKALFDRKSAKVEAHLKDDLEAVIRQLSQMKSAQRGGEGIQRLVKERAELENSLMEISEMRQEWEAKYSAVEIPSAGVNMYTGSDLSTRSDDERPLPVHVKRCREVEVRPQEGIHQVICEANLNRVECDSCGRRFSSDRIETHARICARVKQRSKQGNMD